MNTKLNPQAVDFEVLPNGNISLLGKEFMPATPSGDPLHYAYEKYGAVWNDTDEDIISTGIYGDTITYKAGCWLLNEIGDLTTDEMSRIYDHKYSAASPAYLSSWWATTHSPTERTNLNLCRWSASANINSAFGNNRKIETVSFGITTNIDTYPTDCSYAFTQAVKLHTIIQVLNVRYATFNLTTFENCSSLRNIRFKNLKQNIFLNYSPLLSKASLFYMIDNCYSNATFTITLHADVYAKCVDEGEWVTDIENAISSAANDKETVITLASA